MNFKLINDLDPVFETIGLMALCHEKDWQEATIRILQDYGFKDEAFFQENFKIVQKYLLTFQKNKISDPDEDLFFNHVTDNALLLLIMLAVEKRDLIEHPSPMDVDKLRRFLAYHMTDSADQAGVSKPEDMPYLPDEKAMIAFLEETDIKDEEKWCMLDLLRQPDLWLSRLLHLVRINLPAYQAARKSVEKPLKKLLNRKSDKNAEHFLKIAETCAHHPTIYRTLVSPLTQIVYYSCGYLGLLMELLTRDGDKSHMSRDLLMRQLKALSDNSKMDILCALKTSSKYNLELSETLGLSPSTTSHHMNALLLCEFVTVEKKDGKVYYCLKKEVIQEFILGLEQLLL